MIPVFFVYVVALVFGSFVNLQRAFNSIFDVKNTLFLIFVFLNILIVIYCASITTSQAEITPLLITKVLLQLSYSHQSKGFAKDDQTTFVAQYFNRKLDVANILFAINWSLFVTVSGKLYF